LQPDAPKLRVLHLSDLHFDMEYQVGEEADCAEAVCCRPPNDIHERVDSNVTVKQPAQYWGTLAKCDSPYRLGVNMFQHIARTHTDVW
jgi:sphingomyelin phosphodiesterase